MSYPGTAVAAFRGGEVVAAVAFALVFQGVFLGVLVAAGNSGKVVAKEPPAVKERPISVKPMLDPLPLLKLGGKKMRPKLPDMWKKQAPVKRYEAKSAPTPKAPDDPASIPTTPVATGDAAPPPPDAEVAKQVDDDIKKMDASPDIDPTTEGPGSPDGVKEGTETDPLKARAVSLYRAKIIGWFSARFRIPAGQFSCDELKRLSAGVAANVGGDRSISGYSLTRPSGNPAFDARVKATMDSVRGQQLPPPPPMYPDILDSVVYPNFLGRGQKCTATPAPPVAPSPPDPDPGQPPGNSPAPSPPEPPPDPAPPEPSPE